MLVRKFIGYILCSLLCCFVSARGQGLSHTHRDEAGVGCPAVPAIVTNHSYVATDSACNANLNFANGTTSGWTITGVGQVVSSTPMNPVLDTFGLFPVAPPGGTYALRLGNWYPVAIAEFPTWQYQRSEAQNTFFIPASNPILNLQFAFDILAYGSHTKCQAAFIQVLLTGPGGPTDTISCGYYKAWDDASGTGTAGFQLSKIKGLEGTSPVVAPAKPVFQPLGVKYLPWRTISFDLSSQIGKAVTISVTNSWCIYNIDWAYSYVAAYCAPPNKVSQSDTLCGSTPVKLYPPLGFSSYSWAGPVNSTADTLVTATAGTYTLTCYNGMGCPYTYVYTLKQANVTLNPSFTSTSNCSATVGFTNNSTVSVGTIAKSLWSFGDATNDTLTVAGAGNTSHTYAKTQVDSVKLTIITNTGCKSAVTKAIHPEIPPVLTCSTTAASCGNDNGTAKVTVADGVSPYTYLWSTAGTGNALANLAGATYTLTVTDANACSATSTATVSTTGAVSAALSISSPLLCAGASNGALQVAATGGTPNYTYSWSNGSKATTTSNASGISNLAANAYSVTVTDANACTAISTANLIAPTALSLSFTSGSSTCGKSNGTVNVVVGGGVPAYSYTWSNGSTASDLPAVAAGQYTLTVADANGCLTNGTTTVKDVSTLNAAILPHTALKCNGDTNGTLTVRASGGTGTLTYSWSNSIQDSAIVNLPIGNYTVTVTDAAGCSVITNTSITQPPALTLIPVAINATCNGLHNGIGIVSPGGGVGSPYQVKWSNNKTGFIDSLLSPGQYFVTVADLNGCHIDTNLTIAQPNPISASMTALPTSCNQMQGSVSATNVQGGTPGVKGYTYLWSTGATAAQINNLAQGTYTVTITDANKCTAVDTAVVVNLAGVQVAISSFSNLTCYESMNGAVTALATGGTTPYAYSWSNGSTSSAISNLSIGSYTVTVTDFNNCKDTISQRLTQPQPLTNLIPQPDTVCVNQNEWLHAKPSGGTPPYQLIWNPGNYNGDSVLVQVTTPTTFTVAGVDANGCNVPSKTIALFPKAMVNFTADHDSGCPDLCVHFKDLTVPNGNDKVLTWFWNLGSDSTATAQNPSICFSPGTYSIKLTVKTQAGCIAVDSVFNMITVFNKPTAAFAVDPTTATILDPAFKFYSSYSNDVTHWVYLFKDALNDSSNVANPVFTYDSTGSYCPLLKVQNVHGCIDSVTHCVSFISDFSFYVPDAFTPDGDHVNDYFYGVGTGYKSDGFSFKVLDRWGQVMFSTTDPNQKWDGIVQVIDQPAPQDVYSYIIILIDNFNHRHELVGHVTLIR